VNAAVLQVIGGAVDASAVIDLGDRRGQETRAEQGVLGVGRVAGLGQRVKISWRGWGRSPTCQAATAGRRPAAALVFLGLPVFENETEKHQRRQCAALQSGGEDA